MNLGIYNERHMYNENVDFNKHIEQGVQFKYYGKKYNRENEHKLLEDSSSPHWGSIVEALTGIDSTQQPASASTSQLSTDQASLNKLISEYSILYNTYTSTMINKAPTDAARVKMEADLTNKQAILVEASKKINDDIMNNPFTNIQTTMATTQAKLGGDLIKLAQHQKNMAMASGKYDKHTMAGAIETTTLSMTSMYYHYLVYFLISLTLIAFTFNILINPNADVISAIIVVSAIVFIYIIARHYTIPL